MQVYCKLFFGYAPGGGTPDTTIPYWLHSGYILGYVLSTCWIKLYCWSQVTVYSLSSRWIDLL